jgi:hypothetical protein
LLKRPHTEPPHFSSTLVRRSSRPVLRDGTSRSLDAALRRILDAVVGSQWVKYLNAALLSIEMKNSAAENKTVARAK